MVDTSKKIKFTERIREKLSNITNDINKKVCKRSRKITFKDILYYSSVKNLTSDGNEKTISQLKGTLIDENIKRKPFDVNDKSIRNWIEKIDCEYINDVNEMLENYLYENERYFNKIYKEIYDEKGSKKGQTMNEVTKILNEEFFNSDRRYLACDGTELHLPYEFVGRGFPKSSNGLCSAAYISGLFDINTKTPINFNLFTDKDERKAVMSQIEKYSRKGDVIIADRGYFSNEFICKLKDLGCDFVLRLKGNLNIIKPLKNLENGSYTTTIKNGDKNFNMRIIKYTIPDPKGNSSEIYVCTSLSKNIFKDDLIKNLYAKRWSIETNFYFSKYYLSLNNLKSKKVHTLTFDIYIHNFILLFDGIINRLTNFDNILKKINNYNINKSNSLTTSIMTILKYILYVDAPMTPEDKILNAIFNISKCVVRKRPNRHNPHIRKRAPPKFTSHGNRFDGLKKRRSVKAIKRNFSHNTHQQGNTQLFNNDCFVDVKDEKNAIKDENNKKIKIKDVNLKCIIWLR